MSMLPFDSTVKRQEFTYDSEGLSFVSMSPGQEHTIGERVGIAIAAEGRSQNAVEAELIKRGAIKSKGQLSSLVTGRRGTSTVKPEVVAALAEILHVQRDWLMFGIGPMRRDGRTEQAPFETAMQFARQAGCREDAIQSAWQKLQKREPALLVHEWALAFDAEARAFEIAKIPRPENVQEKHAQIQRAARKLSRKKEKQGDNGSEQRGTDAESDSGRGVRKRAFGGV